MATSEWANGPYWVKVEPNGEHQVCGRHAKILFRYSADMAAAADQHCKRLQRGYITRAKHRCRERISAHRLHRVGFQSRQLGCRSAPRRCDGACLAWRLGGRGGVGMSSYEHRPVNSNRPDDGRCLTARATAADAVEPETTPVSSKAGVPIATLAERIEQAEGPGRDLDREIAIASGRVPLGFEHDERWPTYTASLDAAMTLVPECEGWVIDGRSYPEAEICCLNGDIVGAAAATPALALCAAALRARGVA